MAVKFTQSFATLFSYSIWRMYGTTAGSNSISVYSGAIPATQTIISNWSTYNYNSSLCLWSSVGGCTLQILTDTILSASALPAAAAPLRNGTASWFILWSGTVNINSVTIPSTKFMVGDVSNLFGTGILKFTDTALSTSTSIAPSELSFKINFTG